MVEQVILNYWAILVAAIASFIVGALWYGPIFGKVWQKMMGFNPKSMKTIMNLTATQAMFVSFIMTLVASYVLAHFVDYLEVTSIISAIQLSFWLWLGIGIPLMLGSFLWESKPFKLFLLNASYRLVELIIMTSILAIWI